MGARRESIGRSGRELCAKLQQYTLVSKSRNVVKDKG
jgi:hypothetical protein